MNTKPSFTKTSKRWRAHALNHPTIIIVTHDNHNESWDAMFLEKC